MANPTRKDRAGASGKKTTAKASAKKSAPAKGKAAGSSRTTGVTKKAAAPTARSSSKPAPPKANAGVQPGQTEITLRVSNFPGCENVKFSVGGEMGVLIWGPSYMTMQQVFDQMAGRHCSGDLNSGTQQDAVVPRNVFAASFCYWDNTCGCPRCVSLTT